MTLAFMSRAALIATREQGLLPLLPVVMVWSLLLPSARWSGAAVLCFRPGPCHGTRCWLGARRRCESVYAAWLATMFFNPSLDAPTTSPALAPFFHTWKVGMAEISHSAATASHTSTSTWPEHGHRKKCHGGRHCSGWQRGQCARSTELVAGTPVGSHSTLLENKTLCDGLFQPTTGPLLRWVLCSRQESQATTRTP